MKHHYPVRALSLLCALAIFVSLIPAVSAAVSQDVLKNHTITDTVTPAGVQLNLFDYWVDKRTSPDNHTEYANVKDSGINEGHYLKFISSGPVSKGDDNINQWTGSSSPKPGIVKDRLSGGYPVLTSDNAYGTNQTTEKTTEQPLAYLFDKSDEGGTYGSTTSYKKTFWDVAGLLRVGKDGYYYYNANQKMSARTNMKARTMPTSMKRRKPSRSTTTGLSNPAEARISRASSSPSPTRRPSSSSAEITP